MSARRHGGGCSIRQPGGKRGRMRPVAIAALDRLVGDEPGVAAAARAAAGPLPTRDVRGVLVLHAEGEPVERRPGVMGEVEDELLAVVEEAIRVDGFVVADRKVLGQARTRPCGLGLDRDRFDPVNEVLQLQVWTCRLRDIQGGPWIASAPIRRSGTAIRPDPGRGRPPRPRRSSTANTHASAGP